MLITVIEDIAFYSVLLSFIYGIITVCLKQYPLYFKLIIGAIGCYTIEELWVNVNAFCGYENSIFSVRLLGIVACFATFLTANTKAFSKIIDSKNDSKSYKNFVALIAPLTLLTLLIIFISIVMKSETTLQIVVQIIVILPAIVDSYFEFRCLIASNDEKGILKCIKPINALALAEYLITVLYVIAISLYSRLALDIISAIVMALIVLASKKGAIKWKTLT